MRKVFSSHLSLCRYQFSWGSIFCELYGVFLSTKITEFYIQCLIKVTGFPLNNFVGAKINNLKSSQDRFMC